MIVGKGVNNNQYARYYYYENQELIFAYLEGSDAHRLYFYKGKLFRWRYTPNAADSSEAENHDKEDSEEFREWETFALKEGYMYNS